MRRARALPGAALLILLAACGGPNTSAAARPSPGASPDPPGTIVFRIDATVSTASYTVTEHVPTISQFHPAIGTFRVTGLAPLKSGSIHLAPDPAASSVRRVQVDPLALKSDIAFRDTNVDPLLTSAAGDMEFDSTSISGIAGPVVVGTPVSFRLAGQLEVHGTVQRVELSVTATEFADRIEATATGTFDMTSFGVVPPSGIASTVDPTVTLTVKLVARR